MPLDEQVHGVLITGVYGAGKSSVAAEIADMLERQGSSYGALDLDWLMWFDTGAMDEATGDRVFMQNFAGVDGNYLAVGVKRFVFAGFVRDRTEVARLAAAVPVPLRVVRLVTPTDEIERRLRADPTTGRGDDLRHAMEWLADRTGEGVEDLTVGNEGSIQDVATRIVEWLGWLR